MRHPTALYGEWDYTERAVPGAYDATKSYRMAAEWVLGANPERVEDWGCGTAWMRQFIEPRSVYIGIDGARDDKPNPFAVVHADLRTYRSSTPAAVMRHVLEHNHDWRTVAQNFTDSWTERAALVLFIPVQPDGDLSMFPPDEPIPVPDLSISGPDLFAILSQHGTRFDTHEFHYPAEHTIQYRYEAVILMERG